MSFLDSLQEYVNLRYVVIILGAVLFGVGFLRGWHQLDTLSKVLQIFGAIALYIGVHYNAVYNATQALIRKQAEKNITQVKP